jgi:hypothetical protein
MEGGSMKTFIIDWGKSALGSRFALIQAPDIESAFWSADSIGSPFRIAELSIPKDRDGIRYTEIVPEANPFAGVSLGKCGKFEKSEKILTRIC